MAAGFENWAKNDDGTITVLPLTGFESAIAAELGIMLRLECQLSKDDPASMGAVQVVLGPAVARDLAAMLVRLAERIENQAPPRRQN
jgi:hypothetical protein